MNLAQRLPRLISNPIEFPLAITVGSFALLGYDAAGRYPVGILGSACLTADCSAFWNWGGNTRGLVAWPLSFFGWTVIYGVFFTGSLAWRYEVYCHNPDSYTRTCYIANTALGFSTVISFAAGTCLALRGFDKIVGVSV